MADFDLRKLSAPIEELRPEVQAAYDRLDSEWNAIVAVLEKLPIPCSVWYMFYKYPPNPTRYTQLEWRKWNGKRRICIVEGYTQEGYEGPEETEDVIPYEEWSAEQRIRMLRYVPNLFKSAEKQVKAFIEKTKTKGDN